MMEPFNRLHKLELKVYNYSVLDRLDRPQEWRINEQLKARSAEALYVASPSDFVEVVKPEQYPLPMQLEPRTDGALIRIQTPIFGEINGYATPYKQDEYQGVSLDAMIGGRLTSWITAKSHGKESKRNSLPLRIRVYRSWAEALTQVIELHNASFVHYHARTKQSGDHFEEVLRLVRAKDYFTIMVKAYPDSRAAMFNNAYNFYFAHKDVIVPLYHSLKVSYQ